MLLSQEFQQDYINAIVPTLKDHYCNLSIDVVPVYLSESKKRITYVPALCEFDEFVADEKMWKMCRYMGNLMKRTFDKIKATPRFQHLDTLFDGVVKNIPKLPLNPTNDSDQPLLASETYCYPVRRSEYHRFERSGDIDLLLNLTGEGDVKVVTAKSRVVTSDVDTNYVYSEFSCIELEDDIDGDC